MTPERVEQIRQRTDKAFAGPWRHCPDYHGRILPVRPGLRAIAAIIKRRSRITIDELNTADFIAHSRTDIPDLLDDRDELARQLTNLANAAALVYGYVQHDHPGDGSESAKALLKAELDATKTLLEKGQQ